jgi:hypothetical protein
MMGGGGQLALHRCDEAPCLINRGSATDRRNKTRTLYGLFEPGKSRRDKVSIHGIGVRTECRREHWEV